MFALTNAAGHGEEVSADRRARKKGKVRRTIENAALELFAEKGFEATTVDEIAERADICKATFFRYFASKADVGFGFEAYHLDALVEAIVLRPKRERDLEAVRRAVLAVWAPLLDLKRVALQRRAAASSVLLRGMSFDLGVRWQAAIASALARRRGLARDDQRCRLAAGAAQIVFREATSHWFARGCKGSLAVAIDDAFGVMIEMLSYKRP